MSAYLPLDRCRALAGGAPVPDRAHGTVLMADISGFTPLTEAIEATMGPGRGNEELTGILNRVYGALIDQVYRFCGVVIGFSGDAITCWFHGDDGVRAVSCAMGLHAVMGEFAEIPLLMEQPAAGLSLKVAVAQGQVRRMLVGDPTIQTIDVVAGRVLDRMAQGESLARPGELIVDGDVAAAVTPWSTISQWRNATGEPDLAATQQCAGRFAVIDAWDHGATLDRWPPKNDDHNDVDRLDPEALRPWILPPVYRQLVLGQDDFLAQLRPAVPLFVRFGGLDFETDPDVADKLDAYIRWVQHVLSRYQGWLIQVTTGDKGSYLYALFGAPVGNEGDIDRALSAAMVLATPPAHVPDIRTVQIGISRGRLRAGGYGSPVRRTYGALGDDANLAARLMSRAEPGHILVSGHLADLAQQRYRFQPLGDIALKGKTLPTAVYRLMGPSDADGDTADAHGRSSAPMLGRSMERRYVGQALAQLFNTGQGTLVLVEGEAGIGKSRLGSDALFQAQDRARHHQAEVRCLTGSGDALEDKSAYYPFRRVFQQLFAADQENQQQGRQQTDWGDLVPLAQRIRQRLPADLASHAHLLEVVLEGDVVSGLLGDSSNDGAPLDDGARLKQLPAHAAPPVVMPPAGIVRYLASVFRFFVSRRPTLLILEDAHWWDSSSWQLLEYLSRDLRDLMIFVTTRPFDSHHPGPPEPYRSIRRRITTQHVRMESMEKAEASALASRCLGIAQVPAAVADFIWGKAEGNPFYTEELAFALRDADFIRTVDDACELQRPVAQFDIPDTIEGVVHSRIDRLTPTQQLIIKVASVLGRTFSVVSVRDLCMQLDEKALVEHEFADLVRWRLLSQNAADLEPGYMFRHMITRDVAYGVMLFEQRRSLHQAAADWYEARYRDDLAPHYAALAHHRWCALDGAPAPDTGQLYRAIAAHVHAGRHALDRGATPEAMALMDHGLALVGQLPPSSQRDRTELQLRTIMGAALVASRGPTHDDVLRQFDQAHALCSRLNDLPRLFEITFGKWYFHYIQSNRAPARQLAGALMDLAAAADEPGLSFMAHHASGATCISDGDYQRGLMHSLTALDMAQGAPIVPDAFSKTRDPVVMTHGYCAWGQWALGHTERADASTKTMVAMARELDHPLMLTEALGFAAQITRFRGAVDETEALAQEACDIATEYEFPYWQILAESTLAWVALQRGQVTVALGQLRRSITRMGEQNSRFFLICTLCDTAMALTQLDDFDGARSLLSQAKAMVSDRLVGFYAAEVHRVEGVFWQRQGHRKRAEYCFQRALRRAQTSGAQSLMLRVTRTTA